MDLSAFEKQAINPRDLNHLVEHWNKIAETSLAAVDPRRSAKENEYRSLYGHQFKVAASCLESTHGDLFDIKTLYTQFYNRKFQSSNYALGDALGYIVLELERLIKILES